MKRAAVAVACALAAGMPGCSRDSPTQITGADPDRGAELIRHYGCGSCHTIPGIRGAHANVGPALQHVRQRVYIAGVLVNTPDNLIRWIQHPQAIAPHTAMPEMGVTAEHARDIAAYLYSK